jgi:GntR family transcriptional regulator, rspAB operon transcriptional repressor
VPTQKRRSDPPPARQPEVTGGLRRANTSANIILRDLRADIVSMRRKPGEAVSEKEIAAAYGVSRTPVREALLRLADDQLIDIVPQSGTFVARIPLAALPEAILVRSALEQLTAGRAAERATRDDIARLHDLLETQRRTAEEGDRDRFHDADEAFHAAVAAAAGHPGIWTLIQQVKVQVDRYRRLTLPVPGRMTQVITEHKRIVAGIEAHDPGRAVASMADHLDHLRESIANVRDLNPNYFLDAAPPASSMPDAPARAVHR